MQVIVNKHWTSGIKYILKRSITPEPEEEIIPLKSEPVEEIIPPVSISTTPSQSEEDDDEFDDETEEFSFYKFSILHFQGSATHTHISKRLQQSLLHHDDEGDAVVRGHRRKNSKILSSVFFISIPDFSSHFSSRHVCLWTGLYCATWQTCQNQNRQMRHL